VIVGVLLSTSTLLQSSLSVNSAGASTTASAAAGIFTQIELGAYNALVNFDSQSAKLSKTATKAKFVAIARSLGSAFDAFQSQVKNRTWPSVTTTGLRTASSVTSALITDMINAESITNAASASAWESKTGSDLTAWVRDVNIVNRNLGLPSFTSLSVIDSCQADGATLGVATQAFKFQNPSVAATKALLIGKKDGGPYIQSWPKQSPHYTFSLSASGQVLIAAPSSVKPIVYKGPTACNAAF
jgi:hypothetical protein